MRRWSWSLMVLVWFSGLPWSDCAGETGGQTASMPVMVIEALGGNKAEVPGWQPAVGQGISEMLIESLENSENKFQVLDTVEAAGPQSEPGPGATHSAGGQEKPAAGGPAGPAGSAGSKKPAAGASAGSKRPVKGGDSDQPAAGPAQPAAADSPDSGNSDASGSVDSDFMFCGDVTEFTMQTNSSKIGDFVSSNPFANLGGKLITARVEIVWRIVDTETKRVVKRGITACSASGSEFEMPSLASTSEQASKGGDAADAATTPARAKTAASAKSAGSAKSAASAKAAPGGNGGSGAGNNGGNNDLALANNFLSGFNKAFGNAPSGGGGSANADESGGTTARSAKAPAKTSAKTSAKKPGKSASETGGEAPGVDSETYGYGNPEFMNSALGKATCKAVTNIIEQLAAIALPEPERIAKSRTAGDAIRHTPGKILAVAGKDTVIVSLGSKEGFKAGDQLGLYQENDVKDDKGNVVFTDEKLVGEITLSEVQEDRSRGSYSGDLTLQQGWLVKAK